MSNAITRHRPTKYEGEAGPPNVDRWKCQMEVIFETVKCPDKWQVDQVAMDLNGPARVWWQDKRKVMREFYQEKGLEFIPFLEWVAIMTDYFVPEHIRTNLMTEYDDLKMTSDMTV